MKRRNVALLTGGAVVIIAAAIVATLATGKGSTPPRKPQSQAQAHPAAPTPGGTAAGVAKALRKLVTDPQSLVAGQAKGAVGGQARVAVPAGTTITAQESSWEPGAAGGGTMIVTLRPPGALPVSYLAVMVREDGNWKVLGTIPIAAASQQPTPAPGAPSAAAR